MFGANSSCAFLPSFVFQISGFWLAAIVNQSFSCLGLPFQKPICVLKVNSVTLSVQKYFLVFLACFLPRCLFQVVSATSALKLRLI
ncbi:hypothetical protein CGG80_23445 [Vibrio parahaemolyticus]|nr:hypothetical protein CGJ45_23065 [Vibrio parahaemolyticus]TOJ77157.1 hypothetical protein CGI32_24185 [Vibrio parahaemolyticus]TOQ03096.1 hypothetical protein CGH03_22945 [Vibrio parahaemolyticus]TOR11894.1 hypothetical protein CGG80_23445 [Vibrio parahaemolyticus]